MTDSKIILTVIFKCIDNKYNYSNYITSGHNIIIKFINAQNLKIYSFLAPC